MLTASILAAAVGLATIPGTAADSVQAEAAGIGRVWLVAWREFSDFREESSSDRERVLVSPTIDAGEDWDEMVPSWGVSAKPGAGVRFEVRVVRPDSTTKWYVMGDWSPDPDRQPRTSVNGQRDDDGNVLTDILALTRPARFLQFRITFRTDGTVAMPELKFLSACFRNSKAVPDPSPNGASDPDRPRAWGKVIEAPRKAQMNYENGNVICSPTSLAMQIGHWGAVLNRDDLKPDVPDVVRGVMDPGWPGTGNWTFNAAFAHSLPGMRGYVARFRSVSSLERWIEAGVPLAVSVSYDLLKGRGQRGRNDGHIVVLVGFTEDGDPVFNDPGRNIVRLTYKRADFEAAWASSANTVYVVYPIGTPVPKPVDREWFAES
ncbi:MAG: C39 family peptidase [Fimbriimonadaceae bacterium]